MVTAIALGHQHGGWEVVAHVAAVLAVFALPVSMAVAILKYRLYDIDRIISRTVAYAIITGLLVGVYAALVLLATQVFGLHSAVAVAAATLAAAALFSPVRSRVQRVVDRRFNRARYDAERTVAAFAARLKDTVDLDSVQDELAGAVPPGPRTRPRVSVDEQARVTPRVSHQDRGSPEDLAAPGGWEGSCRLRH